MNPKGIESYIRIPSGFQVNRGQSAPEVKFLFHASGYNLFLTPLETVVTLRPPAESPIVKHTQEKGYSFLKNFSQVALSFFKGLRAESQSPASVPQVRLKLNGANENPEVIGLEKLPGKANYFIGEDPSKWYVDVPIYAKVKYSNVYPGIDIVYSSNQEQLEWDYIVQPGTDPGLITIDIDGSEQLTLDAQGDLLLTVCNQQVRISKPVVYQKADGQRSIIPCSYKIKNKRQVSFLLGNYDTARTLVIDPVITFSTYLGGSEIDYGYHIAVDPTGNAYLTGTTASIGTNNPPGFPTKDPYQANNPGSFTNAFVSKISATGALIYSTYLGGTGADGGHSIAVDATGSAYVTGQTTSDNFPTHNAIQNTFNGYIDAFVTKLNPAGNALVYSTYLGGRDGDAGFGIAVDPGGNAYVTGYTESSWASAPPGFPIKNPIQADNNNYPSQDVFITKLNTDGSLSYSTYLGGWRNDIGYAIAVDSDGNSYITGFTESSPPSPPSPPLQGFPVTAGSFQSIYGGGSCDAFITKLNADGSLGYSSYLGGTNFDEGRSVAVDSAGYAYVTGFTASSGISSPPGFPTRNPIQVDNNGNVDAFVTKINPTGSSLVYSTYLGGTDDDRGTGIAVDLDGNAYVTGVTTSSGTVSPPGFPIQKPIQDNNNGSFDIFIAKINSAGSALLFSTYLGGKSSENDPSFYSPSIALASAGNAYVTGSTWSTWTPSDFGPPGFPVVNPIQSANYGAADVFVLKLNMVANLLVTKFGSPDPVRVGNNLVYQILIANNGPDTATDIVLVDQLPPDVDFIAASTGCSQAGGIVTCNLDTLEPNNSSTVTIIVRPKLPGVITNTATVTSEESSPTSTTITTQVTPGFVYTNITIFRNWRKYPPQFL